MSISVSNGGDITLTTPYGSCLNTVSCSPSSWPRNAVFVSLNALGITGHYFDRTDMGEGGAYDTKYECQATFPIR